MWARNAGTSWSTPRDVCSSGAGGPRERSSSTDPIVHDSVVAIAGVMLGSAPPLTTCRHPPRHPAMRQRRPRRSLQAVGTISSPPKRLPTTARAQGRFTDLCCSNPTPSAAELPKHACTLAKPGIPPGSCGPGGRRGTGGRSCGDGTISADDDLVRSCIPALQRK